ncbi:conserved hypothetical protein [Coccidioides posadasii str. Silveira]|uniref:Uncharacterized protein n=1 Tax=Coccidioides posadasii (strain RMSCC 757 / Silveira) TaxID=443226 RepID=E9DCU7_COCPS|nr:conserved hypothetical protein [Coccidioides posadasii str. Silveira]
MSNLNSDLPISPHRKPKKMSLTQTYFLAHTARAKLSREAGRPDHNLRLLVGHANMLDLLMLELAEAEKEQERWFDLSVHGANTASEQNRHIQWADMPVIAEQSEDEEEEEEEDDDWNGEAISDTDSDDDSDYDGDDAFFVDVTPTLVSTNTAETLGRASPTQSPKAYAVHHEHVDDDESFEFSEPEEDDEEDVAGLALTRTHSHSQQPPELLSDSGDDSEDEVGPPSPPQPAYDHFPETEPHEGAILASRLYSPTAKQPTTKPSSSSKLPVSQAGQSAFLEEGYYIPSQARDRMIEAY